MAKYVSWVILFALLALNWIAADHHTNADQNSRTASDPVSNLFSELGDLFLDVDKAISAHTAPKAQHEDSVASHLLGPRQPRKDYFDRIQENYKTLQNRLGPIIEQTLKQGKQYPLRSGLVLPRSLGAEGKLPETQIDHINPRHEDEKIFRNHGQENTEDPIRKVMEKLISDTRQNSKFIGSLGSKVLDEAESALVRRGGDISEPNDSDPRARIIGDSLYSESSFDNSIRRMLRNHGRWVLDNPLLQRWQSSVRVSKDNDEDASRETLPKAAEEGVSIRTTSPNEAITESFPFTTESTDVLSKRELIKSDYSSKENSRGIPVKSNFYRINDGRLIEEEINVVLQPESDSEYFDQAETVEETGNDDDEEEIEVDDEPQETVILAFTPDGVPLKLRMGPEIENPIEYLHEVLQIAGVSLKLPVESREDPEPVGEEVVLLGVGSGVIARAVYLDLSNQNELKSLVRVLMKAKVSEKEY